MIAEQRDKSARISQLQNMLDHLAALGASIDAVAEHDQRVVAAKLDQVDKSAQRSGTSVDITDSNDSRSHGAAARRVGVSFDCG
jgi:hypothetical protein